ncbi:outer membrane protein transport protein [bacterium]|nr:outer membrane protein transport protein [bacterium]
MKRLNLICFLMLGLGLAAAQTTEEAVNILENSDGAGIRALSMGRAFVGVADDYSALYWNAAGLSQLKTSEIGGGFRTNKFNNEAIFQGETENEYEKFSHLSSAAFAYKFPTIRGGMGLALGFRRMKDFDDFLYFKGFNTQSNDLSFEFEDEAGLTDTYYYDVNTMQSEEVKMSGGLGAWSLGIGAAISPNMSVGATFSRYTGKSQYDFAFYQDDVDGEYFIHPADFDAYEYYETISAEYRGYGVQIGALMNINPDIKLGATIDLPTTINVKEMHSADEIVYFDNDEFMEADLGNGEWEYDVVFPARFSVGGAFNLRSLILTGSVQYCDWSGTKFKEPEGAAYSDDYPSLLADNRLFSQDFRATLAWGIGGELRMPGTQLLIRGGYHVAPSPLKDADNSLDKKTISAGLGFRIDGQTTLEVGMTRTMFDRFTSDGWAPGGVDESIVLDKIMAGVTIKLPNW